MNATVVDRISRGEQRLDAPLSRLWGTALEANGIFKKGGTLTSPAHSIRDWAACMRLVAHPMYACACACECACGSAPTPFTVHPSRTSAGPQRSIGDAPPPGSPLLHPPVPDPPGRDMRAAGVRLIASGGHPWCVPHRAMPQGPARCCPGRALRILPGPGPGRLGSAGDLRGCPQHCDGSHGRLPSGAAKGLTDHSPFMAYPLPNC
jgi:hypothetical protein